MFAKWRFSLLCFALVVSASPAFSSDGTVTVTGEVLAQTCTINSRNPDFTVNLPILSTRALSGVGTTAGSTHFAIALTGCVNSAGNAGYAPRFTTHFELGSTINVAGRLTNQTGGGANVDGQIQNADGSAVNLAAIHGSQNTTPVSIVNGSATQHFNIAYFANADITTVGGFNTSVVYTLVYP